MFHVRIAHCIASGYAYLRLIQVDTLDSENKSGHGLSFHINNAAGEGYHLCRVFRREAMKAHHCNSDEEREDAREV